MININAIVAKEVVPGFWARFVHADSMTLAYWEVKKGSSIPLHKHIHEQVMQVHEGEFEFTVNGETRVYTPGMAVVTPSMTEHGGTALTDCKLFDVFSPVREDYKAFAT